MTNPSLSRVRQAHARRLHLVMRDGTMVEGHIMIGEDQALVPYLNGRRGGWMTVTRAHRPRLNEPPAQLIVQSEHVILATAPDGDVQIATAPPSGVEERSVEAVLLGGKVIRGFVNAAARQRLSDYISSQTGKFMWLQRASLEPDGRALGDLALHMGSIEILRDLREGVPIEEGTSATEPAA
ncbi:MAG: hypothetical protein ACHQSE_06615 [Gemmatimonadales bacterium]